MKLTFRQLKLICVSEDAQINCSEKDFEEGDFVLCINKRIIKKIEKQVRKNVITDIRKLIDKKYLTCHSCGKYSHTCTSCHALNMFGDELKALEKKRK